MSNRPIPKSSKLTILGMIVAIGFVYPSTDTIYSQTTEKKTRSNCSKKSQKTFTIYTSKGAFTVPLGRSPEIAIHIEYSRIHDVLAFQVRDPCEYDIGIKLAKAFIKKHPKHHLVDDVHIMVAGILARKGNIDAAVEKLKWLAANFPRARKQQGNVYMHDVPLTMDEEWNEYVKKHPILTKDYIWYKMGHLYEDARRYEDALSIYDHLISVVEADKLPDTNNICIVDTFRTHKYTLEAKMHLLRRMRRMAMVEKKTVQVQKLAAEIKKATAEYEKLYPEAAWEKLRKKAFAAVLSYECESKKLKEMKDQADWDFTRLSWDIHKYKEKTGHYPEKLSEISVALPKDAYSLEKEDYHYKLIRAGFIISSCGRDRIYGSADDILFIVCDTFGGPPGHFEGPRKRHELKPLQNERHPQTIKKVKTNKKD